MRNFVIVALTLLGSALAAGDAQAQRWAQRGRTTYIYPQGTQGYFVGPQGTSNLYTIPTVTNGIVSPRMGGTMNYYSIQPSGAYNHGWNQAPNDGSSNYYSNQSWGGSNEPWGAYNRDWQRSPSGNTSYYSNQSWGSYSSGWRQNGGGTFRPFNYDPNR